MSVDYTRDPLPQLAGIASLEQVGLDVAWVPEAWGFDAPSLLGFLAARTERLAIASGVLPVQTRTPSLIAQTAAGLDAISRGRFELGLGTSGPQVVEGFHGVPYAGARERLRDTVAICRLLWAGGLSRYDGHAVRLPLPEGSGTGHARPLRLLAPGGVGAIPVHLAVMRPGMVELAAEIADGWYPLFFAPGRAEALWGAAIARGTARRAADRGPLQICVEMHCAIGTPAEIAPVRAQARAHIARYVGGMGARGRNFYTDVVGALGWPDAARTIQDHYLGGRRDAAAEAIPDDLLDAFTLCGSADAVAGRVAELRGAGVTTLIVRPPQERVAATIRQLRQLIADGTGRA